MNFLFAITLFALFSSNSAQLEDRVKDQGLCPPGQEKKLENKWYYNGAKGVCLAYQSEGCITDLSNAFDSLSECQASLPADGPTCSGASLPIYESEDVRKASSVSAPTCDDLQCAPGFTCQMGAFFGRCCHDATTKIFNDAFDTTCPSGKFSFMEWDSNNGRFTEYLGDSCQDLQCPSGYKCEEVNEHFAKCCGAVPEKPIDEETPEETLEEDTFEESSTESPEDFGEPELALSEDALLPESVTEEPEEIATTEQTDETATESDTEETGTEEETTETDTVEETTTEGSTGEVETKTTLMDIISTEAPKPVEPKAEETTPAKEEKPKDAFIEDDTAISENVVEEKSETGSRLKLVRSPTPLNPVPLDKCLDAEHQCPQWAEAGDCDNNAGWMLTNCQKSCNCCGCSLQDVYNAQFAEICEDHHESCGIWAENGHCQTNRQALSFYCRKSCGIC